MKKVFLSAVLGFIMVSFCNAQIADNLAKNPAFIENVKILNQLSGLVDKNFGENLKDLTNQIEVLKSKEMSYEESISVSASLLKLDQKTFLENLNKFKENYQILIKEFGQNLNQENINAAAQIQLTASKASPGTYGACCIVAYALGFTTLTACTGATWGFGAPLCLTAAIVVQTAAIKVCAHNYLSN